MSDSDPIPTLGLVGSSRWPQKLHLGWLTCTAAMLAFGVLGGVVTAQSVGEGDVAAAAGFACLVLVFIGLSILGLGLGGFRSIGLSRRIVQSHDQTYGRGIEVPTGRYGALLLAAVLASGAAYGLTAAAVHFAGIAEALLPEGRDTGGGAALMALAGSVALVAAVLCIVCRPRTVLGIYPSGVHRRARQWRRQVFRRSDLFLAWDDVASILPDEMVVHTGWADVMHPMIKLATHEALPAEDRLQFDEEATATVMAKLFVAEPNTLLALLQFLKDNPDRRYVLERPDARELLRPPPLRERFRAARLAKSSGSGMGRPGGV